MMVVPVRFLAVQTLFKHCSQHTGGLHAWGDHKSGQLGLGASSGIAGMSFIFFFVLTIY